MRAVLSMAEAEVTLGSQEWSCGCCSSGWVQAQPGGQETSS